MSLLTTRNTYVYKHIRLYFYFWRWYLCGGEKQSQIVRAHEGIVGRRKSQWKTDFSRNSGTYIVYNSHVTGSSSSFSLTMVTPTSHLATCPSPVLWANASATITEFKHVHRSRWYSVIFDRMQLFQHPPYSQPISVIMLLILSLSGCSCLNNHWYTAPVDKLTFGWSRRSYPSNCPQHPLYSHPEVTLIYYTIQFTLSTVFFFLFFFGLHTIKCKKHFY